MRLNPMLQPIILPFAIFSFTLSLVAQLFLYISMCPELYKLAAASNYSTQYIKREVRKTIIQFLSY
jgi:hypothetical protein